MIDADDVKQRSRDIHVEGISSGATVPSVSSSVGHVMSSEQERWGLRGSSVFQSVTSSCLTALLSQAESCSVVRLECAN